SSTAGPTLSGRTAGMNSSTITWPRPHNLPDASALAPGRGRADMADRGHQGKAYEDCRAYVLATFDDCLRCGLPVDKELSGRHLWGPTLDLIVPWSKGGPMT